MVNLSCIFLGRTSTAYSDKIYRTGSRNHGTSNRVRTVVGRGSNVEETFSVRGPLTRFNSTMWTIRSACSASLPVKVPKVTPGCRIGHSMSKSLKACGSLLSKSQPQALVQ